MHPHMKQYMQILRFKLGSDFEIFSAYPMIFGWHFRQTSDRDVLNFDKLMHKYFSKLKNNENRDCHEKWWAQFCCRWRNVLILSSDSQKGQMFNCFPQRSIAGDLKRKYNLTFNKVLSWEYGIQNTVHIPWVKQVYRECLVPGFPNIVVLVFFSLILLKMFLEMFGKCFGETGDKWGFIWSVTFPYCSVSCVAKLILCHQHSTS